MPTMNPEISRGSTSEMDYQPLTIDNLPERLLFNRSSKLRLVSNLLVNASQLGRGELIPTLEKKYDEVSKRIVSIYTGGIKGTAELGAMIDKANMWKMAGLFDRWLNQLEAVHEFEAAKRQIHNQPPTPVTGILDSELDKARHQAL